MKNENEQAVEIASAASVRALSRHVVTCPSGLSYLMRRAELSSLIKSGVLPENFVAKALEAVGKKSEAAERDLTDEDILNSEASARAMITATMIQPRIVEHAEADDEMEYLDIPSDDRKHLSAWIKGELPETPIQTTRGEVTSGQLSTFPVQEQGSEPAGAGDHGG